MSRHRNGSTTFDRKRIYTNPSSYPNSTSNPNTNPNPNSNPNPNRKAQLCFRTHETTIKCTDTHRNGSYLIFGL